MHAYPPLLGARVHPLASSIAIEQLHRCFLHGEHGRLCNHQPTSITVDSHNPTRHAPQHQTSRPCTSPRHPGHQLLMAHRGPGRRHQSCPTTAPIGSSASRSPDSWSLRRVSVSYCTVRAVVLRGGVRDADAPSPPTFARRSCRELSMSPASPAHLTPSVACSPGAGVGAGAEVGPGVGSAAPALRSQHLH